MIQGEYQKILLEVFDVLEVSEDDRLKYLDGFKRKLANELLLAASDALSVEQKEWLEKKMVSAAPDDPQLLDIQKSIYKKYSVDDLVAKSRPIFKSMLEDYVRFMSKDLSAEKAERLEKIVNGF